MAENSGLYLLVDPESRVVKGKVCSSAAPLVPGLMSVEVNYYFFKEYDMGKELDVSRLGPEQLYEHAACLMNRAKAMMKDRDKD